MSKARKLSVDLTFQAMSAKPLPFLEEPPLDPRPRIPSTSSNMPSDPLELKAPLQSYMSALSSEVKKLEIAKAHRVVGINQRVLSLLHRISPPFLGGCCVEQHKVEGVENSVHAQRRNAWVKRLSPFFTSSDLIELYYLVSEMCTKLETSDWQTPKNHRSFRADGGWAVYILKLHQLVLVCLSHPELTCQKSAATATPLQSNSFETRSLWNAACEVIADQTSPSDHRYAEDAYREYHNSNATATLPDATVAQTTAAPSDSSSTKEEKASNEKPPLGKSKPKTTPMELFFVLMNSASDYQQFGTSNEAPGFMPAQAVPPAGLNGITEEISLVYSADKHHHAIIAMDLNILSFAINGGGRYDAYLWSLFIAMVEPSVKKLRWQLKIPSIFKSSMEMIHKRAVHALRVFRHCTGEDKWSESKVEYLTHILLSSSPSAITDTLGELVSNVWYSSFHRDEVEGLKRLEGILVALLGHSDDKIRSRGAVLLNMFYDCHDWQADVPFVPVIKQVGDLFEVTICLDDAADPKKDETPEGVFLILSAPSFHAGSHYDAYSYHQIDWQPTENVKGRIAGVSRFSAAGQRQGGRHRWIGTVKFANFSRCGFFDWRVVRINEDYGSWETVQAALNDIRRSSSSSHLLDLRISLTPQEREAFEDMGDKEQMIVGQVYPHPQRMAEVLKGLLSPHVSTGFVGDEYQTFPLQGRFIVQARGVADEQVHEIFIDQHGCEFDPKSGQLKQRGSFASVTASLSSLRDHGVSMVHLMGALSRDNGEMRYLNEGGVVYEREDASPFAVVCRCTPNSMLGGAPGLLALLKEAKRVGIKIVLDSLTRVASSRTHRKHENHLLHYLDAEGKKCILYGSGGRAANYEDTCQLNYRKVECWDLMVTDMKLLSALYGVDGLRLEQCQSWPPILTADISELHRKDPDGVAHYGVLEQLEADVVVPMTENNCGYWGSKSARNWANPFLVKICKEVWRDAPEFVFVGECFGREDDRQAVLARSGIIPQLQDMPEPLARVFGQQISPVDSSVSPCPAANVEEIISWFDSAHLDLPEGAVVIQSSCSHSSPLPALLYGRGAWPAVDLLFFLPDIPSTFAGEMDGQCFRLDITNVFSANQAMTSPTTKQKTLGAYRPSAARSLVNLLDTSSPQSDGGTSSRGPKPLSALRSLSKFEPVTALPKLEEEHMKKVGPEYGFDLKRISGHYQHRRRLRHRLRILRSGILVPLRARHNEKWHPRVLSFLRFDAENGEFILVAVNFSDEVLEDVSVSLKALSFQFRDMGLESATTFVSADLFAMSTQECVAQDKVDSRLNKIGSHRELGEVPLLGGQHTLGKLFTLVRSYDQVYSMAELLHKPQMLNFAAYGSVCYGFKPVDPSELTPDMVEKLYRSSLSRLNTIVRGSMAHAVVRNEPVPSSLERVMRFNFVIESLISSILDSDLDRFASVLVNIQNGLKTLSSEEGASKSLHELVVHSGLFCSEAQRFNPEAWIKLCCRDGGGASAVLARKDERTDLAERFVSKMMALSKKIQEFKSVPAALPPVLASLSDFADEFVASNNIGPIVFITTELGKWSTVGGLGVMVDELSCTLAGHLGQTVYIVTPYYHLDRQRQPAKMDPNEVQYKQNITVTVGGETIEIGVHEGKVRNVNIIFLHNARFFPYPYPNWNVPDGLRFLSLIGKASLEVLCQKQLLPQLVVTNDWPTGLVSAYGKNPHFFGESFRSTTFFHIVHNLDANYEGRLYADRGSNHLWITELSSDLLVDPTWSQFLYNPSRCALLCSDAWGTVSPSYRDELRKHGGSALQPLLNRYPSPFAYPNGVPLKARLSRLASLPFKTHDTAKAELQRKYFKFESPDLGIPLFAFIGRITEQKGVHHIVDAAEQLIQRYQCKIQILVGGKVTWNDPYSAYCGHKMNYLHHKYPFCFWASPDEFFGDGPLVNVGADVSLMPSKFEPGGIVQHEFFIAGTPVLAFRTGGLKDTVYEFDVEKQTGNGFTFEAYQMGDFLYAMERAWRVVKDPAKYEKLRENAKYSVISCEQVAQAWLIEFCRLRRKLPVNYSRLDALSKNYAGDWNPLAWANNQSSTSKTTAVVANRKQSSNTPFPSTEISEAPQPPRKGSSLNRKMKNTDGGNLVPFRLRFTPKFGIQPRAVAVSGTFDDWQVRRPMAWDNALQAFSVVLALRPGKYVYKLIVDGAWMLNPEAPSEINEDGVQNNVLIVN